MNENAISLYALLRYIHTTLNAALPATYWVRAEISEGRQNSSGHYYCKFIEKNAAGQDIASASGIIWASTYFAIKARFERETGQRLTAGIKVLVNVKVNFHERYGLSLVVNDIDPSYTIGDMVRRRKEIIARLTREGVIDMNRQLALPRPLLRVAVITSATAAGYGDFCNHLAAGGAAFRFEIKLFPAVMQGDAVESSVVAALNAVAAEAELWDAVVIIRGGGAVSDLNGFETYTLAANVAQFVLPVITGIGHERDETVIDLVANTRCKTPTAVADFLVGRAQGEMDALGELTQRLQRSATLVVAAQRQRLAGVESRVAPAFSNNCGRARQWLDKLLLRVPQAVSGVCSREEARRQRLAVRMEMLAKSMMARQKQELLLRIDRMVRGTAVVFQTQKMRLDAAEKSVKLAGPERVFRLGFSLTTVNGKAVTDAAKLKPGDEIATRFAKGKAVSIVKDITEK